MSARQVYSVICSLRGGGGIRNPRNRSRRREEATFKMLKFETANEYAVKSGRGQPHSKTLRALREPFVSPTGLGVRLPSAALALYPSLVGIIPFAIQRVIHFLAARNHFSPTLASWMRQ